MTTIINNPSGGDGSSDGTSLIVGIIALVIVVTLFFIYIVPMIRSGVPKENCLDLNVKLPAGNSNN